jgi:GT2 family glycosyltransferase
MSDIYKFDFEAVSVYANAVDLILRLSTPGQVHLDLGCGHAAIAGKLNEEGIRYIGFDFDADTVEQLQDRGIEAYRIDLTQPDNAVALLKTFIGPNTPAVSVSMLDVIEHLDHEASFLSRLHEGMTNVEKLTLVLSVPNFSHTDVSLKLLGGRWDYTPTGLLDHTHQIIYTGAHLGRVMEATGWKEVASHDYHLELSDQYFLAPHPMLNRDMGIGLDLVRAKKLMDPFADVHQFVRAYHRQQSTFAHAAPAAKDVQTELLLLTSPTLFEEVRSVVSDHAQMASVQVACLPGQADLKAFWESPPARYWALVNSREELERCLSQPLITALSNNDPRHVLLGEGGVMPDRPLKAPHWLSPSAAAACPAIFPGTYPAAFRDYPDWQADPLRRQRYLTRSILRTGALRLIHDPLFPEQHEWIECEIGLVSDIDPALLKEALPHVARYDATAREELSRLRAELNKVHRSLSWKLTWPIRAIRTQISQLLTRQRLRAIYHQVPLLRPLRMRYLQLYPRLRQSFRLLSHSRQNTAALQDLSAQRFVLPTAMARPVSAPIPITVSVVTYNSGRWIQAFIHSLEHQAYPLEHIHLRFIDHGSTDDTGAQLTALTQSKKDVFGSVEFAQQANAGFGAGHDRVLRAAATEFCLVTNIDIEFERDAIGTVVKDALSDTRGNIASWELRQSPYEHPKYYDPVTLLTNWSSHACILVRREAYLKVGGYDHAIFMYCEDVELSYRFRSYGYGLRYVPKAVVLHHTYEEAGQVKPLQFSGSALGNVYLRLRYGNWLDRLVGLAIYAARLVQPEPYPGSRRTLLNNLRLLISNAAHFLRGRGTSPAHFPFRAGDYELTREGAFFGITTVREAIQTATKRPLVTVITRTVLGREALLEQAARTVFNQTYPFIEFIVAQDGGTPTTSITEGLEAQAPPGMSFIFLGNAKVGRSAVGNAALRQATGDYVMFLDDDDLLFPDHVEVLLGSLLRDRSLEGAYSLAWEVQTTMNAGHQSYTEHSWETPATLRQEWDYGVMKDHNFLPIQSVLFSRKLFERWGGFNECLDQLEDWNLWLRYGYRTRFVFVPKTTSLYRTPQNFSVRSTRQEQLHAAYFLARQDADQSIQRALHEAK